MGRTSRGFTIIESLLFLAITGVLVIAMVAGTGVSINVQRYRDAVETFKSLLQSQYSELASVQNDRSDTWSCNAQAESQAGGTEARGQSDCVLVGRYVAVDDASIKLYAVLARENASPSSTGTDIEKLRDNYTLNTATVYDDETVLEWDTRIAWPSEGLESQNPTTPRQIGILFVRSPDSGQIYTFTSDDVADTPTPQLLSQMLVAGATVPGQQARTICIDSNGLFINANQSIYVNAYASGPTAIESQSNDYIADPNSPREDHTQQC